VARPRTRFTLESEEMTQAQQGCVKAIQSWSRAPVAGCAAHSGGGKPPLPVLKP